MPSVIVSACRTPIGAFLGALSPLAAPELGAAVLREALKRSGYPEETLDAVIMGNVLSAGVGQAPARQAALKAGIPHSVGALTINKVCGSGLQAVMLADQAIRAGDARAILAGGMESMSNAPFLLPRARSGLRMGHAQLQDALLVDGLEDPTLGTHMGLTGELCAREQQISRQRGDAWAAASYQRALSALAEGAFEREVVAVPARKGDPLLIDRDEIPRPTTEATLAGLRPAFDPAGTITAGSSSKVADGAAAVCVLDEQEAVQRGIPILARIVAAATHSREPERLMMAPEHAIRRCLERAGWETADLYEINEPFAAATVALVEALGVDPERVNVHGGAVALGHPIGATGCRMLVTLLHALERHGLRRGVAALCLGGGEAVALAVERP
jgi:acetyl-CoA C-acetyltransferase